jgi:hypothetical protein
MPKAKIPTKIPTKPARTITIIRPKKTKTRKLTYK